MPGLEEHCHKGKSHDRRKGAQQNEVTQHISQLGSGAAGAQDKPGIMGHASEARRGGTGPRSRGSLQWPALLSPPVSVGSISAEGDVLLACALLLGRMALRVLL